MQKFTVGQHVMVKDKYGTRDYVTYNEQIVLGFYRKNPSYSAYSRHSNEFIEDPSGNYVRTARETRVYDCNGCANTGVVDPYWETIDDVYTKLTVCPNCQGKGKIISQPSYSETTLNRKDFIMSMEDYQPIVDAKLARQKREQEYATAHTKLVSHLIADLVNVVLDAEDKVTAAAEFIAKYSYAQMTGHGTYGYVKQSTLYEAAAKVREENRKREEESKLRVV